MEAERRQEVLRAIVHSRDPSVSAGDRLRALELLRDLEGPGTLREFLEEEIANLTEDELAAHFDATQAALLAALLSGDESKLNKFPETAKVVRDAVALRA